MVSSLSHDLSDVPFVEAPTFMRVKGKNGGTHTAQYFLESFVNLSNQGISNLNFEEHCLPQL